MLFVLVISSTTARAQAHHHDRFSPRQIRELIAELRSPNVPTRRNAAHALSKIYPLPPEAIPAVAQALNDSDPSVQSYALTALVNGGAASIPALKALLDNHKPQDIELRTEAIEGLGRMAKNEPATWPILVNLLSDPRLQPYASFAISAIGAPIVPMLRPALTSENPVVRMGAVAALQMAPGAAKDATPELIATLKDPDPSVRALATIDLGRIGPPARSAIPALTAALNDPRHYVRDDAAIALAKIDPSNKQALPTLIIVLDSDLAVGHWDAVRAIGNMGANARAAIPTLEHLLASDPDPRFRAAVAEALVRMAGTKAVPALAKAMTGDKDAQVRLTALNAISTMGARATPAIPALVDSLNDPDQQIRDGAARSLASLGERARPALLSALQSPDLYTREWAIQALAESKPLPHEVVHALTTVAHKDKSALVRYDAANALDRAGIKGAHALLEKSQQEMVEALTESPLPEKRLYRRQQIFANIPPGNNHEYPLRLIYLLSFGAPEGEMLAAVYRGEDRNDRLIVWRQTDNDHYQQIREIDAGPDPGDTFDPPKIVFIPKGQVPGLGVQFLDVGENVWRGHTNYLFAINGDHLQSAVIESPEQWYRSKLRPGEEIFGQFGIWFSNREAKFNFYLRIGRSMKQVVGTFKVVRPAAHPLPLGFAYMVSGKLVHKSFPVKPIWTLVLDSARIEPLH